jgi:hypothetical protein
MRKRLGPLGFRDCEKRAKNPREPHLKFNASFLGVTVVVFTWHHAREHSTLPGKRLVGAVRAGIRHTRYSPRLTAILLRTGLFTVGPAPCRHCSP